MALYTEYDMIATVYRRWSLADPAFQPSLDYYRGICKGLDRVVELGVGDGRIAIEVARNQTHVTGVDSSKMMLDQCRKNAAIEGVSHCVELLLEDVRRFSVEPVELVIFPFRSIGHLITHRERMELFENVRQNLVRGGRFVLDHYVFNIDWARENHGKPREMCSWTQPDGTAVRILDIYHYNYHLRRMDCRIRIEYRDSLGRTIETNDHPLTFSWIEPEDMGRIAREAGFSIEDLHGDFVGSGFGPQSTEQVWILRK